MYSPQPDPPRSNPAAGPAHPQLPWLQPQKPGGHPAFANRRVDTQTTAETNIISQTPHQNGPENKKRWLPDASSTPNSTVPMATSWSLRATGQPKAQGSRPPSSTPAMLLSGYRLALPLPRLQLKCHLLQEGPQDHLLKLSRSPALLSPHPACCLCGILTVCKQFSFLIYFLSP